MDTKINDTKISDTKISKKEKELIKKEISKLEYNELLEVYKIIKISTDKISKNKNGVFINLKYVPDDTLLLVKNFIKFRKDHKETLDKIDLNLNTDISKSTPSKPSDIILDYTAPSDKSDINDKFCFQNFIEKLSINSHKLFPSEYNSSLKPSILNKNNSKLKYGGVKNRLLKKCRDIHNNIRIDEFTHDNISIDDNPVSENIEKIRLAHKFHSIGINDDLSSSSSSDISSSDTSSISSHDSDAISTSENKLINIDDDLILLE